MLHICILTGLTRASRISIIHDDEALSSGTSFPKTTHTCSMSKGPFLLHACMKIDLYALNVLTVLSVPTLYISMGPLHLFSSVSARGPKVFINRMKKSQKLQTTTKMAMIWYLLIKRQKRRQ